MNDVTLLRTLREDVPEPTPSHLGQGVPTHRVDPADITLPPTEPLDITWVLSAESTPDQSGARP